MNLNNDNNEIMKRLFNTQNPGSNCGSGKTGHIVSLISHIRQNAHKFLIDELEKNNVHGLATSHGEILVQLFHTGEPVTMQVLAKRIRRDKSTVTTLITKLHNLGYIEKKQSEDDKRVTYISLSDKGQTLNPVFQEISNRLIDKVYGDMTQEEQELTISLLERIAENLK